MRFDSRKFPVLSVLMLVFASAFAVSAGYAGVRDADFDALIQKKGEPAKELVEDPTIYREAELNDMPCSADDFEFLLDRPLSSVALAGKMHKSLDKYTVKVVRPGVWHIDDQGKLVGDMELVSRRPGKRIYYFGGYWKIVAGVKLRGRMALVVVYKEGEGKDGRELDAKARGYMLVDNSVAGAAFRLAAYLFPGKVDARIKRFATAVKKVVEGLRHDPEAACRRLEKAQLVPPGEAAEFRTRFLGRRGQPQAPYLSPRKALQ